MLSIRTQDRMSLVPYDRPITVERVNVEYIIGKYKIKYDSNLLLGTYATIERTLEILNEIEEHVNGKILISQSPTTNQINDTYTYVYNGVVDTQNIHLIPTVYQMPKE